MYINILNIQHIFIKKTLINLLEFDEELDEDAPPVTPKDEDGDDGPAISLLFCRELLSR